MKTKKQTFCPSQIVVVLLFLLFSTSMLKAQHPDSLAQAAIDSARWDSLQQVQAFEQMRCVNIEGYLTACNFQCSAGAQPACSIDSLHHSALSCNQAKGDLKLQIQLLSSDLVEEIELKIGRSQGQNNVYSRTISLEEGALNGRSRLIKKRANVWEFQLDRISRPYPLYIRLRLKSVDGRYSATYNYDLAN
ncbi:hypothetical protein SGRA_0675 [Saprospira grandis str. Lewin]|uniref:Secreted protein n=2 Tax=Saprospira TaxID=1007 RepID=H6L0I4_SAPGL|nr:hypothetical protein SGRA_0675 [Saprospira grandis str. Lewin]